MAPLLLALLATADGGSDRVRFQAAVVVASTRGKEVARVLAPLEKKLKTLLPYTSYKGFTEYTASLSTGQALDLHLPDGRWAHLSPRAAMGETGRVPLHVSVDRGEQFDSQSACDQVTVFQLRNGSADQAGDRTFLVFEATCPGDHPPRLIP